MEQEFSDSDDIGLLRETRKDRIVVEDESDEDEDENEDESASLRSVEEEIEERRNFESQLSESYEPLSTDWKDDITAHWESIFPVVVTTGTSRMSQKHYKILQFIVYWE